MILHVIDAKYLEDYRIEVSFNDGKKGIVDLSQSLQGSVFSPLKNKKIFSQFKFDRELDTIVWPNGVDVAPEYLYFQAFKNESILQEQFKKWGYIAQ